MKLFESFLKDKGPEAIGGENDKHPKTVSFSSGENDRGVNIPADPFTSSEAFVSADKNNKAVLDKKLEKIYKPAPANDLSEESSAANDNLAVGENEPGKTDIQ